MPDYGNPFRRAFSGIDWSNVIMKYTPTGVFSDYEKVVRCEDCKYGFKRDDGNYLCKYGCGHNHPKTHYCSYGERRTH